MKILLIDDSKDMGFLVQRCLAPMDVTQVYTLKEAEETIASTRYDLLLIDVTLPDGSGFTFCDGLSRKGRLENVPKILLSAHADVADKVFGLNCGADDYVTKPFEMAELRARVDSRLRQAKALASPMNEEQILAGFTFQSDFQKCLVVDGAGGEARDLQLTPTEYRLLLSLARAEGRPLSREDMVRAVWTSNGMNIEKRGIDSHIAHLRKKIAACPVKIVSVYGKGYTLKTK